MLYRMKVGQVPIANIMVGNNALEDMIVSKLGVRTFLITDNLENPEKIDINKFENGISLTVENNYLVPVQYSGIVVFVGEKKPYGNTVIIESDNVTIWYSNIDTSNIKVYDHVEKGKYLGETLNNKLYLVFKKEGNFVDYKEYI